MSGRGQDSMPPPSSGKRTEGPSCPTYTFIFSGREVVVVVMPFYTPLGIGKRWQSFPYIPFPFCDMERNSYPSTLVTPCHPLSPLVSPCHPLSSLVWCLPYTLLCLNEKGTEGPSCPDELLHLLRKESGGSGEPAHTPLAIGKRWRSFPYIPFPF